MIQKCSRWKVLAKFLRYPDKHLHIREISRDIKLAPTSVKNHIDSLIKKDLIQESKEDIFKSYKANFDNEKFRFYKKINTLITLKDSGLIEFLDDKCSPDTIILFGSTAKGEDLSTSDIDIFLLAKEKKLDLTKYEKKLNRKIQLFFSEDLNKLPKELRNNIVNGIKLKGYLTLWT